MTFVVPIPADAPDLASPLLASLALREADGWQAILVHAVPEGDLPADSDQIRHLAAGAGARLSEALSLGLAEAQGDFVAFLNPSSILIKSVVSLMVAELLGGADVAYGDELIGGELFRKPVFSPERLRCQPYLGDAAIFRTSLVREVGGITGGGDGAELYDLALRATRAASTVAHVAEVVSERPPVSVATQWEIPRDLQSTSIEAAIASHLLETGGGEVFTVGADGVHHTERTVHGEPLVSIVIPTRGDHAVVHGADRCLVVEAVRSVIERSTYRNVEFVVVLDTSAPEAVSMSLREIVGDRLRLVPWDKPFSFSGKVNLGVLHAKGEFVLLLNDDVEVISPRWIEPMLGLAQLPRAGIVGPMLYFEDETIQHAGHAYVHLDATHIGLYSPRGSAGPWGAFRVDREVAGVTAACALIRRDVFIEVGGLSPLLPGNFNDVDLCMKLWSSGYQAYWTPHAELYHFESKTRDPRVSESEIQVAWGRWENHFWSSPWWPNDPHEVIEPGPVHRYH